MRNVKGSNVPTVGEQELRIMFANKKEINVLDLKLPRQEVYEIPAVVEAIDHYISAMQVTPNFDDLVRFVECVYPEGDNYQNELYLINLPNLRLTARNGSVHYFRVTLTPGYYDKYSTFGISLATHLVLESIDQWSKRTGNFIHRDEYISKTTSLITDLHRISYAEETVSLTLPNISLVVKLNNGLSCKTIRASRIKNDRTLVDSYFLKITVGTKETIAIVDMLTNDIPLDQFITPEMLHQFGESIAAVINQETGGNIKISVSFAESYLKLRKEAINQDIRHRFSA